MFLLDHITREEYLEAISDDIEIDSSSGTQTIEYAIFHEGIELVAGADS